jgi:outer membrane protein TolC
MKFPQRAIAAVLILLGLPAAVFSQDKPASNALGRLALVSEDKLALNSEGKFALRIEDKLVLTLDESIRLALQQNPFYLAEKAKEAGASAGVREAVSGFFPSLNAQGTDILDKKVFSITFPSFFPGMAPQTIKMDFTRTYQLSLNFGLPLYAGGRLMSGFRTANYNLESTRESIRQTKQETVFNVKKAFYGYLLAGKFVEVSEEALSLAEKHRQNVQRLYDVGMASKFDLLRSKVAAANLKPQVIRARNGLNMADLGLKILLGLDLKQTIEVKGELSYKAVEADADADVAKALTMRPDISQLNYQKLMASEMLKMARAAYLPTLAVGGQYNYWSNTLNLGRKNWDSYYTFTLVLNVPIFNGFVNQAKVGAAEAVLKQLELTQKGFLEKVKFDVQSAILDLRQARESLQSQEKNVEQAVESVRIAELNFQEGLATNLDVSSVRVALSEARTNYTQALFDYAVALAALEKAVGQNQDSYER